MLLKSLAMVWAQQYSAIKVAASKLKTKVILIMFLVDDTHWDNKSSRILLFA